MGLFCLIMNQYYTYILFSEKADKFYIGYTSDIQERVRKHNSSTKGFTTSGKPWKLVYFESYQTKGLAMKREKQLKSWKNAQRIKELINKNVGSEHSD